MYRTHSMPAARRHEIMIFHERSSRQKISFGNLVEKSKTNGKARAILTLITGLIISGVGLLLSPTIMAARIASAAAPTTVATTQQTVASQFDFFADKAVVYGIPIVIAVAIYVAIIFSQLSRKIAG